MNKAIETTQITKHFKHNEVLEGIDMTVKKGEIYGFLGENGAGKTTFMKLLLGLVKPSSGEIKILGNKIETESRKYLSDIGSMIEYPVFYEGLSAQENLELHCAYMQSGAANISQTLKLVGLTSASSKPVKELSLGMKQRLGIARAIVTRPALLILDEPVNGLDPTGIRDIRMLLLHINEKWGTTILISSHIVSEVESIADRIGILHNGKLTAGMSFIPLFFGMKKKSGPSVITSAVLISLFLNGTFSGNGNSSSLFESILVPLVLSAAGILIGYMSWKHINHIDL